MVEITYDHEKDDNDDDIVCAIEDIRFDGMLLLLLNVFFSFHLFSFSFILLVVILLLFFFCFFFGILVAG